MTRNRKLDELMARARDVPAQHLHFTVWWVELNDELAKLQRAEANQGEARRWYNHGTSPAVSAQMIMEEHAVTP